MDMLAWVLIVSIIIIFIAFIYTGYMIGYKNGINYCTKHINKLENENENNSLN